MASGPIPAVNAGALQGPTSAIVEQMQTLGAVTLDLMPVILALAPSAKPSLDRMPSPGILTKLSPMYWKVLTPMPPRSC